jgi:hypothetical protein
VIAAVLGYAPTKSTQRQKGHELRKNQLALVHGDPLRMCARDNKARRRRSNRDQTEKLKSQGKLSTYDVLMSKRWDTTDKAYNFKQSGGKEMGDGYHLPLTENFSLKVQNAKRL